jgi:hypothetical protein
MPEDIVLDENLKQIVVMKRQIRHLETEGEEIDACDEKESLLVNLVDTVPPLGQYLIQWGAVERCHEHSLIRRVILQSGLVVLADTDRTFDQV